MRTFRRCLLPLLIAAALFSGGCYSLAGKALGSDPGKPTRVVVEKNLMVPMRDGVRLATDIYRPVGEGKYPVVITRIPYGTDVSLFEQLSKLFTQNGYVFVAQDTRGEFDSEGDWFPMIPEYDDGHDTIEWLTKQPWYNGKIGMFGGSYFGYTQIMSTPDNDKVTCTVPLLATGSIHKIIFRNGVQELVSIQGWLVGERNTQLKRAGLPANLEPDFTGFFNEPIRDARPIDYEVARRDPEMIKAGPEAWLHHPGDSEFMPPLNFDPFYARVSTPALMVAGWYDMFLGAQINDFVKMRELGVGNAKKTRLIIAPMAHGMPTSREGNILSAIRVLGTSMMQWYDYWLKDKQNGAAEAAPIKLYVMGENVWRDEYEWPLARTRFTEYFLHSGGAANTAKGDGSLSTRAPGDEPADHYQYDPNNPVPTAGGNFLGKNEWQPGPQEQGNIPMRPDVLVYMTEPLTAATEVTGPIQLVLYAASSARDTDWVAKLLDIDEKGKARLLQAGVVRARYRDGYQSPSAIEPGTVYEYQLDMWSTSNLFKKGHRIALWVTSSDFPQFDRNSNAAGEGGPDNIIVADQTIYHDSQRPSRLILPVIPR